MRKLQLCLMALLVTLCLCSCPGGSVFDPGGFDNAQEIQDMLARHNATRQSLGLSTLVQQATLMQIAQDHAEYMASRLDLTHVDGNGGHVDARATAAGYAWVAIGENIGYNSDPDELYQAWTQSAGHYANISGAQYTEIGIGVATVGTNQYWCIDFGDR